MLPQKTILLTLFLFIAVPVFAIEFDVWETGITRSQMIDIAREQNLSLARHGDHPTGTDFDPQQISGPAKQFFYFTTLYQNPARVSLSFSSVADGGEPLLSRIEATFSDKEQNKRLLPYIARSLTEKYGRGETKKNFLQKELIFRPVSGEEVRIVHNAAHIKLRYTDLKLEAAAK